MKIRNMLRHPFKIIYETSKKVKMKIWMTSEVVKALKRKMITPKVNEKLYENFN